ncbi:exodeoxyribonuclease VII large subunit [Compostibacter hankyongensis]|uniref:Exodeoxyribonuclease 7 large subunit n=1 Tax=Compostibacter hankyongensis TaxID=1007089 RepID=A0ABP8FUQ9_9BACT
MPEKVNEKTVFSLLEVMRSIQKTLEGRYTSSFWVKAEMNKLNHYSHSGHCYPELVEKREGKVIAQIRSILWKEDYKLIDKRFQQVLNEPLRDGIKILFAARITFDPVYGLTLRITDIDPAYTLGDLEREKQETLMQLKQEGLFGRNKMLSLPLLPQRIAVISVETSKGYADFLRVIDHNPWGYRFFHLLFPALLQGEKAVASIRSQLKRIQKVKHHFDVVALVRGGGGDIGLSCYNSYLLSREIALFPLPVITGIGHATNETVAEMIAFQNAITPTKIGEYLLQRFHNFAVPLRQAEEKIAERAARLLREEKTAFLSLAKYFRSVSRNRLNRYDHELYGQTATLLQQSRFRLQREKEQQAAAMSGIRRNVALFRQHQSGALEALQRIVTNLDPVNVLRRGYSITRLNGRSVKAQEQVKEGDILETQLFDGGLTSKVTAIRKTDDDE